MTEDIKDMSFDDAWDSALEKLDYADDVVNTDTSVNTDDDTESNANTANLDEDTSSTTHGNEDEDGSAAAPSTVEEAVAQAKIWEQRFKSIEGRFNAELERRRGEELERQRQFVDALSKRDGNYSDNDEPKKNARPAKFEELAKDFPEIAEAVEELLAQRLRDTEEVVKRTVDERIQPITSDLSSQRMSSHLERILSKHPDAVTLRTSGKLDAWIETLPLHSQYGAKYILNNGAAEEVVTLLDQYKDYNTTKQNNNQNTDKSTTDQGGKSVSQGLVEAVKAGLAVKAAKSADPKTEIKAKSKDDFDAGWEDAIRKLGAR